MPENTAKKNLTILLILLCLQFGLFSQTMVMPFKVTPPENTTYQWLGRAVSFFLSIGLQLNSVKIFSETKLYSILHENNIDFPYHISKASGIKLGLENNIKFLVWGEIITSSDQIELKPYVIDLKNFTQKYLPLLKFDIKNFFVLQQELLKDVLKFFGKINESVIYPQLNLDYHSYENLVKSFLVKETAEKISMLEKTYQSRQNSDFLNFELANAYLSIMNYKRAHFFLEKVSNSPPFIHKKNFLNALILYNHGYPNIAIETFIKLRKEDIYSIEIDNNLGAIYLKQKYYPVAEQYFLSALNKKKDPRIYLNYLKLLIDSGKIEKAINTIHIALSFFPSNEKIRELFYYYMGRDINKNVLTEVFKKYLPDLQIIEVQPEISIQLMNPLGLPIDNSNHFQNELNIIMEHYYAGNFKKTLANGEELLEINPFIPELHHLISSIFLKQEQMFNAEKYAISSNYLKKSKDNYLILIEIYKKLKNKKRRAEMKAEMSRLFPENKN